MKLFAGVRKRVVQGFGVQRVVLFKVSGERVRDSFIEKSFRLLRHVEGRLQHRRADEHPTP